MSPTSRPRWSSRVQDGLVRLLGSSVERRGQLVAGMLRRDAIETTSYWLQLVVSVGIATLGLVLGSAAVIIGAMLVAPLMGPIIGLAMGLATGSPFLVLRSAGRVAMSAVVAIAGAAAITLLLPFHELNAEISARATPTILDLVSAAFCAVAGVYAALRPGDTVTTAAGTSISISLVPPLCASGYGFGTAAWPIARGAALLFLTNVVAIVVVGIVGFVASGFNRVDVIAVERGEHERSGPGLSPATVLARRLSWLFESRWGPGLRFLMPFVLLGVVYLPLRRGLDEVAWQVRVRAAVRAEIAGEPRQVVESRVRIERHEVEVVLVLLGTTHDAEAARVRIDTALRDVAGVAPHIEVVAVPDATAFAGLESTLFKPHLPAPKVEPPSPADELTASQARVRSSVEKMWPSAAAGAPLVVDVGTGGSGPLRVRVVHLGEPLRADATETLGRTLEANLGRASDLVDVAVPSGVLTRDDGDLPFIARVSSGIRATVGIPAISVCVVQPAEPPLGRKARGPELAFARSLDAVLAGHPRVVRTTGSAWSVRFVVAGCAMPPAPDGGTADGGAGE